MARKAPVYVATITLGITQKMFTKAFHCDQLAEIIGDKLYDHGVSWDRAGGLFSNSVLKQFIESNKEALVASVQDEMQLSFDLSPYDDGVFNALEIMANQLLKGKTAEIKQLVNQTQKAQEVTLHDHELSKAKELAAKLGFTLVPLSKAARNAAVKTKAKPKSK